MRILSSLWLTVVLTLLFCSSAVGQRIQADGAPQTFDYVVEQYLSKVYFAFSPSNGTAAGLHQYDTQLEDYSPALIAKQIALRHAYEKRFMAIDGAMLDASVAGDREMVLANLRSGLLTLEVIKPWETNPDTYSSGVTASAFTIMERPYAPANTRLRALIAREKLMPHVLEEARTNLRNCPKIYTEIALEQLDGNVSFFEHDVPSAFADATDAAAQAEFAKTNAAVIAALKSYGAWMKADLLPRSNGDYKLGADTFRKKLLYDEMVDVPLDHLLEIAYADLHKNQAEFARVAKEIDPAKTPQQVLAELATVHPCAGQAAGCFSGSVLRVDCVYSGASHHYSTEPG